jgi:phosphatidyl-myo-inositol dimannoside synthase
LKASEQMLIVASEFPPGPGGIGRHAFDLARALSGAGITVTVCANQDFCLLQEAMDFNKGNVDVFKFHVFKRKSVLTQWNRWLVIKNQIRKTNPSRIILSGRFSLWMAVLIRWVFGKKYPIHAFIHGSEFKNSGLFHRLLTKYSVSKIDYLWPVSDFTNSKLKTETGRDDGIILPNGVWINDWNKSNGTVTLAGEPALLTVGRISSRKGQHRVVKALPLISKKFPAIHYHIAGLPGKDLDLKSLAAHLQVESLLTFHGRIKSGDQLELLYRHSKIFVMLSQNQPDGEVEGYGIAILEANSCGIPAIGSTGCGISDAIMDGFNGRLIDGNNESEFVNAITEILNNYNNYSKQSKEWAAMHDWPHLINYFLGMKSPASHFREILPGKHTMKIKQ